MSEPIIKKNPRKRKNEELNKNNPLFREIAEVEVSDELKNYQPQTEPLEPMEKIPRIYIMGGAVVFAIAGLCYFKLWSQPTPQPSEPKPQPPPKPLPEAKPQKTRKF